ncbi:hypothetical protein BJY01DRAFT_210539, partial [Aspergillus pseudoustus]
MMLLGRAPNGGAVPFFFFAVSWSDLNVDCQSLNNWQDLIMQVPADIQPPSSTQKAPRPCVPGVLCYGNKNLAYGLSAVHTKLTRLHRY